MANKKKDILNLANFVEDILGRDLKDEDLYDYVTINILPDIYDPNKSNKGIHKESHFAIESLKNSKDDFGKYSYWKNFVGAYKKDGRKNAPGTPIIKNDIKKNLYDNPQIVYNLDNIEQCTVQENMLNKMGKLIDSYEIQSKKDKLLSYLEFEYLHHEKLVDVCIQLLENGSKECLEYLLFLLVLVCIYQNDIKSFSILYNKSTINALLSGNKVSTPSIVEVMNNPAFVPFTNKKYCHKYHIYLHRVTYPRKYLASTLEFVENEDGSLDAILILSDHIYDKNDEGRPSKKIFRGKPIHNKIDDIVYIPFTSSSGSLSMMFFKYEVFDTNDMEFRTALYVSSYPKREGPVVQKVVISKNEVKDTSVIDGILKMSNSMITISEDHLNEFMEVNKNQKWFNDFKDNILPFIQSHSKKYYVFSEEEIVSYTNSELERKIKIEIAKLLQAKSKSDDDINLKDFDILYRVVKDYTK